MTLGTLLKATALVAVGALGVARADEEKGSHEKLPATVKAAIMARFPEAEVKSVAKESKGGEAVFAVLLTFHGDKYDVAIEADGEIAEIEREILPDALPSAVLKAVRSKHSKGKISKAEQVTNEEGEVFYEVVVGEGEKAVEVAVTPKGKIKEEAEGEEEEKGEKKEKKAEKGEKHEKKAEKGEKHEKKAEKDGDDEEHEKKAKKGEKKGEKAEKKADKDDDDDDDDKHEKKGEKHEKKGEKDDD